MHKLIEELTRLYLAHGASPAANVLLQHVRGDTTLSIRLATDDGMTRALAIPFRKQTDADEAQHWSDLCVLANALQAELGLPAPAVSISGADGYGLWLSLKTPVPTALAQQFVELLRRTYVPGLALHPDSASEPVELPPCMHQDTGKWAAFINPGLGASFADESGLDMAPPAAGQVALLEGVQSIGEAQFLQAIAVLQSRHQSTLAAQPAPASTARPAAEGLLLKNATLEDIVRHLHGLDIEPTFRHKLRRDENI